MDFSNRIIAPTELPSVGDITFQPLEKAYLLVERLTAGITTVVLFAIGFLIIYFIEEANRNTIIISILSGITLITLLLFISKGVDYKYSGYALREKDILFRSGWFIRKVRVVMHNRIQHVSVQSGPLERRFNLASVSIFTAGASEADFTIKGISEETAQQIKAWISSQIETAHE